MKAMTKILAGATGLAAVAAFATPASAQYYPTQPYGYGQQGTGALGAILNSIINPYGRTGYYNYGGEQREVETCINAVQQRLQQASYGGYGYNNNPYGGYSQPYGGYNQPYGGYNQPYGGYNQPYGGYNQPYANNASARIASVDRVERKSDGVRVKGTAFFNAGYAQPYGYNNYNNGYGNRGNVNFNCRITHDMRIVDFDLKDRRTGRRL